MEVQEVLDGIARERRDTFLHESPAHAEQIERAVAT